MYKCLLTGTQGADVALLSSSENVLGWFSRYVDAWWNTRSLSRWNANVPLIITDIRKGGFQKLLLETGSDYDDEGVYFGVHALRRIRDDHILVLTPSRKMAYSYHLPTGSVTILGESEESVALSAAHLAGNLGARVLESSGWIRYHASCVITSGRGCLILGNKGSGKTTVSLGLASVKGFDILANDQCFIRNTSKGIAGLSYPGAITIGLGLLKALGWTARVASDVMAGNKQHPAQNPLVTEFLSRAEFTPIHLESGGEAKYHLYVDNLRDWFNCMTVPNGTITHVLFPSVDKNADPRVLPHYSPPTIFGSYILSDGLGSFLIPDHPSANMINQAREENNYALSNLPQLKATLNWDIERSIGLIDCAMSNCS